MKQGYSRDVNHTISLFHHGEAKPDDAAEKLRRLVRLAPAPGRSGTGVIRKPIGMIF
jgi:hypothetical protein